MGNQTMILEPGACEMEVLSDTMTEPSMSIMIERVTFQTDNLSGLRDGAAFDFWHNPEEDIY
jgi:hypothetical protein